MTGSGLSLLTSLTQLALVDLPLTINRAKDFRLADRIMGWRQRPDGWAWHHVEDGKTLQLIPTDMHKAVAHAGGRRRIQVG